MREGKELLKWTCIATIALSAVACNDDDSESETPGDSFDRSAMLANLADNVIIPAYANFESEINELDQAAESFALNPNEQNLEETRSAWLDASRAWQSVGLYDFGPAFNNGLLGFVNIYPVDTVLISANIETGIYNLESPQNADATGLQAIDYLLWGIQSDEASILNYFAQNENARDYLTDITEILDQRVSGTSADWQGDYRNTFVGATGTDIGSSLGQLTNASIRYLERNLRDGKIGIPAGARTSSGEPLPLLVEGYFSEDHSKELLQLSLTAWQDMFNGMAPNGNDGPGMADYLNYLGTEFEAGMPLHEEINRRFDLTQMKAEPLNENLALAVQDQQIQSLEVFDEMQRTVVLLKVDMTSAMGIQITFADNDGD